MSNPANQVALREEPRMTRVSNEYDDISQHIKGLRNRLEQLVERLNGPTPSEVSKEEVGLFPPGRINKLFHIADVQRAQIHQCSALIEELEEAI